MKQNAVLVASGIPEKIRRMKKTNKNWIIILLLPAIFFACSAAKNTVSQTSENSDVEPEVTEFQLEDQKQKEFEYMFVEALKEKALGNNQRAIQFLSGCLEIDPNSSAAMYELATIHAENNDFTSASLLLEKAINLNPENKWYKLLLAQIYQQIRKLNEAAEIYNELLVKEPENLEFLFMKAALLSNAGKPEEAIQAYNLLEEKIGINEQISVARQQLYVENGQVEKAFKEIEKLIESDPTEPRYYGLMADLFQNQGDSVNALKYYHKIQEIDPQNGFVHFSLANYYLQQGEMQKSFDETKKGFRSSEVDLPTKLQLYMMLTANPSQSGISPEQEDELTDILLDTHPGEYMVHTVRAESFLKRKKLEEARAELLKALEIEKNDYILWERVLFIDNDLQDWQALYEHSNGAMNLFPNQPQVYFLNAIACIQLERFDETLSVSDEGLMYVLDNVRMEGQFLMLKGEALYKTGKTEEAFELFDKSVELDPDNHIALNNYAYYLSLAGKNLDKAERMSGLVIERFPENATYLDTYAWVLFKKGEYKLARFYMESALKNGGDDNSTLLEHYGDILFKLGQTDEAVKYWLKAKEFGEVSEVLEKKINQRNYIEE
jgi:tetratricopeptide (TPR) repeat protein